MRFCSRRESISYPQHIYPRVCIRRNCATLNFVSPENNPDFSHPASVAANEAEALSAQVLPSLTEPSREDPPWTGWDVILLAGVAILAINVFAIIMLVLVAHLRGLSLEKLAKTGALLQ